MKFRIIVFLVILPSISAFAQGFQPDLSKWDKSTLLKARVTSFNLLSTKQEKDVIFYCNLARLDSRSFIDFILLPYLKAENDTDLTDPYLSSLIADLNRLPRLKPLRNSQLLTRMAKDYAISSGKAGIVGHNNFEQRFASLISSGKMVAENLAYNQTTPLNVVIDLLIDDGIPDFGHRNNILSPSLNRVGIATGNHRDYQNLWVMEFSGH
jgi:Cysteine-rich secretory protein family